MSRLRRTRQKKNQNPEVGKKSRRIRKDKRKNYRMKTVSTNGFGKLLVGPLIAVVSGSEEGRNEGEEEYESDLE